MVLIVIKKRGSTTEQAIAFPDKTAKQVTVRQLKEAVAQKFKINVTRQRLTTVDKTVLDDDKQHLAHYGVEGTTVEVKDLGPQMSYRTVFLIEYLGPLLIHPLVYWLEPSFYKISYEYSTMQRTAFALVMLHFLKRELETVFVHRFSHATMPAMNVVRNSAHYWILSGIALAIPLYAPWHSDTALATSFRSNPAFLSGCVVAWTIFESLNYQMHLKTANLRPEGDSKTRAIPRGLGFDLVSFPNYLFEILSWVTFSVLTGEWAAVGFTIISSLTMINWALQKHRRYRKEFGDKYPRNRKAIIPFVL